MRKPSVTYRFFCTLTACIVLLSTAMPVGAHSSVMAGFCEVNMPEHHMSHIPEAENCDMAAHHESDHSDAKTAANTKAEDCPLDFTCTCSLDSADAKTNAIQSLSKIFAGYIPVVVDILDDRIDQGHIHSSEQIFASLYSPPIFLKNSSFLN